MILCIPGMRSRTSVKATLRDALLEITRKNLGMTAICDDDENHRYFHRWRPAPRVRYRR
jgi:hypothetical protein